MNQKYVRKLLSLFLCSVMLLSMLPAVAAATISSVAITGVTVPAVGGKPVLGAAVPEDGGYTVDSISWFGWQDGQGEGSAVAVTDAFQGGWYYQVRVTLLAGGDTEFDGSLSATVNGSSQSVEVAANSTTSVTVKRTFYVEAAEIDVPISSVAVSGLTAPAVGQTPDFSASTGDSAYRVESVRWSRIDTGVSTGLSQNDVFVAGGKYNVVVVLEAASGYSFANSVSCTIDGKAAICGDFNGLNRDQFIAIVCEYTISNENLITEVAVKDLSAPVKGASPDMSVTIASSAPYLVDSVAWRKWRTDSDSSAAISLSTQEKFQTGYNYQVQIVLRAKTDYSFATNGAGEPSVTGTVNTESGKVSSVAGKNAAQYVCVSLEYSLEVKLIQSVSIADVIVPFVGESPSNRTRVSPEAQYTVAFVSWQMCDASAPDAEFADMNAFAIFAGGMLYRVNVILQAKDGAEFAVGEDRQLKVTGTINGEKATDIDTYAGKDPSEYICVSYDFPVLTDNIQHVDVYKIDEPQEGKYPDYESEVPEDALYIVDQITWQIRNKETAEYEKMSAYDTFEEGHEYQVVIRLFAKSGGQFFVNQFDELQVTATINGNPTIPAEAVEKLDPREYVTICYDFSLSTDASVIRRVNLHDLQIPVAGATPDYQVNTDAVAKYTVDSVIWERLQNRRSTNSAELLTEESTFEEGQYYRVQIILKAGEDTVFYTNDAGRPQVTAVLNNGNGMAAELIPGKNPEEYICISYTYGIYSVIEGGDGQWSPDKGTLKFRFTGDFANFVGVRVDGKLLEDRMYTAASGSTIITLQESFLNSLPDGIYELTVIYTDGQVSTKFQVSGGAVSEGEGNFRINPWVFLFPLVVLILGGLFVAVFVVKKRAESRAHKEEFEEYDEEDEEEE